MIGSKGKLVALGLSATVATSALLTTWNGSGVIEQAKTKLTEMKDGVALLQDGEKNLVAKAKEIQSQISALEAEIAKLEGSGRKKTMAYRNAADELTKAKGELEKANNDANRIQESLSKYTPVKTHMTGYSEALADDYVLPEFDSGTYAKKIKGVDGITAVKGSCLLADNNMLLVLNKFDSSKNTSKTIFQKVSINGTEKWNKTLENINVNDVNGCKATKDGGALVIVSSNDKNIIKLDSNGEIEFTAQFDSGVDRIENVIELSNGNYLYMGSRDTYNISVVTCFDNKGVKKWQSKIKCEGGTASVGNAVEMPDGGIIVVGYASNTYDGIPTTLNNNFTFATKYTKDGVKKWTTKISDDSTYYNGNTMRPTSIVQEKDGKCIIHSIKSICTVTNDGVLENKKTTIDLGNKYDKVLNNGNILVSDYFSKIFVVSADGTLKNEIKSKDTLTITNMDLLSNNKAVFTGMVGTNDSTYVGYMGVFDLDAASFPALTD